MDADHTCISVLSSGELWATSIACAGVGASTAAGRAYSCDPRFNGSAASLLNRTAKVLPPRTAVFRSLPDNPSRGSGDTSTEDALRAADDLPGDWQLLHEEHGCRHFAAVALTNADGELVGVLGLASKGSSRPLSWTSEALHSLVGSLAVNIRRGQAVMASPAFSQLHAAATFSDLVQAAAEAAVDATAAVTYTRGQSRVAFIQPDINAAAIFQQQVQEGDTLVSVPLLKARRSSCEFVLMPPALRKSMTRRMSADNMGAAGDRPMNLLAGEGRDGLKLDSWYARQGATNGNASFTLSFAKGSPCKGHTLTLSKTLLGEALAKQVAGLCIDDCQAYTVNNKAYPRDLVLSRGAVVPLSFALATISADGKPLMALYLTYNGTLPRSMLQAVVQELQQLLQAMLPTIRAKLSGALCAEYEYLRTQLEVTAQRKSSTVQNPSSSKPAQTQHPRSGDSDQSATVDMGPGAVGADDGGGNSVAPADDRGGALCFQVREDILGVAMGVSERPSPTYAPPTPAAAAAQAHTLATAVHSAAGSSDRGGGGTITAGTTPGASLVQRPSPSGPPELAPSFSPIKVPQPADRGGGGSSMQRSPEVVPASLALPEVKPGPPPAPPAPPAAETAEAPLEGAIDMEYPTRRAGIDRIAVERAQSACESTRNRRLLSSLSTRSVSFHLEKAQPPRGASKLAPIIASMYERLKAAQAVQITTGKSESRKADLQSVKLLQEIGQGGYGTVYRATYHGAEVAIKVIKQSKLAGIHSSSNLLASSSTGLGLHKQHLHDAIELVASVSMSHTNIVQVPAFFMDVRLEKPDDFSPLDSVDHPTESKPFRLVHSPSLIESPAPQDVQCLGEGAMALVLEYCDCGSLCDAIMNRKFIEKVTPKKGPAGAPPKVYLAINMRSVYQTLLEIALALRHMHSLALVHCDLKPQNVLLKSSPRDPRGFTAKLSDFGLAKMMAHDDDGQLVIDQAVASGTITHVAPEVLLGEPALGAAVDIYAFGILMFQVLCGTKVYDRKLSASAIANAVAHQSMRPTMPHWVPSSYRNLALACWNQDPNARPTAEELVRQLERAIESKNCTGRQQSQQEQQPQQQPQT